MFFCPLKNKGDSKKKPAEKRVIVSTEIERSISAEKLNRKFMSDQMKIILLAIKNESPLLVFYENFNGEKTERIVRNVDFSINKLSKEEIQEYNYDNSYISGFCELRNETRTFKTDRIQRVFIVNMKNDADKLYAIADFLFSISNSEESYLESLINNQIELKKNPNIYSIISLIDVDLYNFELFNNNNYISILLKKVFLLNFLDRFYMLDEKLKIKFNLLKIKNGANSSH